jgi:aerobic carbon-monoxide dehydrogenase medium subunit
MYETHYRRPKDLSEAAKMFAEASEPKYIAGGQTLIPTMKQRLAAPTDVIDLSRLSELRGISVAGGMLTIGAGVTHAEVATSDAVKQAIPALGKLAGMIGDPAVRHRGTIGGSIANNDPGADYPAAALGLGATVSTNRRTIKADAFFTGLFTTALEEGEVITKVAFPVPARAGYEKFRNPASRYAMAAVFVSVAKGGEVRVAVTGAGNKGVFRMAAMEKALTGNFSPAAIQGVTVDPSGMLADLHASAAYRANLVKVMAERAIAGA